MFLNKTVLTLLIVLCALSFSVAQEHHHGVIDIKCDACHLTEGWDKLKPVMDFNHDHQTEYPLEGRHKTVSCSECHTSLEFSKAESECLSCHQDIHEGQFADACSDCHTPSTWENKSEMVARHAQTRYPLVGVHDNLDCQACQASGQYVNLPIDCDGCHVQRFLDTTNPDHQAAHFQTDCSECHNMNTSDWSQVSYVHTENFALTSGHRISDCSACHADQADYSQAQSDCISCHEENFNESTNPNHVESDFSQTCDECHSTAIWHPAEFDHDLARFLLTGAHITTDCALCHVDGQFTGITSECFPCHQEDLATAIEPNHILGQFSQLCEECHSTTVWTPSSFNHDEQSEYLLEGAHIIVTCQECHIDNLFDGAPLECIGCHDNDYEDVDDPNHVKGQFDHDCTQCHSNEAWTPATFDHANTDFPLIGAHITVNCQECHVDGRYTDIPSACFDCHNNDYNGVSDPNHVEAQFDHDCKVCHTDEAWTPATFNHANTDFPLSGAHISVNCQECHVDGQYDDIASECFDCHNDDFSGAEEPNHAEAQFDHDCTLCHSDEAWTPANFDHDNTDYPLTGAHITVNCQECHIDGQYADIASECFDCHEDDFAEVDDPNHTEGQFDHDCTVCHIDEAWTPVNFDHDNTDYPLTGAHIQVNCTECHIDGQFAGTPSECFFCHEDDFEEVDDPNHVEAQFDHDCITCHSTEAWSPADFDHDNTDYPLTGAHIQVNCAECHIDGQYADIASECFDCHEEDYNNARYEGSTHRGAGFSHDCEACHTTNNWDNANFDHDADYFPIFGGNHRGEWDSCSDCHTDDNDYTVFTCIDCHEHNQRDEDRHHDEVRNYRYESDACYECHPDGREDDDFIPRVLPPTKAID